VVDAQRRIPYESYVGFSRDFWQKENWLSLDADTCACVRVVKQRPDPQDAPALTPRGSFGCDNAAAFVARLSPEEQARFRGNCIRAGFKSLAVVPIRYREETLGAIHMADERPGVTPRTTVEFVEQMAPLVGEAIHRFNAEEEIREQAALLNLAHDAIIVRDRDNRITFWNRGAEELYGWPPAEALGQVAHVLLQTEFPKPLDEILADMARSDQWEGELVHTRRDSTKVIVAARWAIQRSREPHRAEILEINRDITSRKRAEDELARYREHLEELVKQRTAELQTLNQQLQVEVAERRQAAENLRQTADELARSNQDLEQFAYVASHDLQEPLRIVAGHLQLLERRYKGRLDKDADDFINFAVDGAGRMQGLIQDLLAYSRVGTRGRRFAPCDTRRVLERALANLRTAIQESGAVLTHDSLPTVTGDEAQLVQLFQNLIANAIKFRGDRKPEIQVGARPEDGRWRFSVKDNGIGIEPQYIERIFVIFQRLHGREKYPGTGIGLAICKRIVERHGGRIWVESQPGQGSVFYFTI
jgi:PAS domain S-box-containing protein